MNSHVLILYLKIIVLKRVLPSSRYNRETSFCRGRFWRRRTCGSVMSESAPVLGYLVKQSSETGHPSLLQSPEESHQRGRRLRLSSCCVWLSAHSKRQDSVDVGNLLKRKLCQCEDRRNQPYKSQDYSRPRHCSFGHNYSRLKIIFFLKVTVYQQ